MRGYGNTWIAGLGLAALLLLSVGCQQAQPRKGSYVGKELPSFEMPLLQGGTFTSEQMKNAEGKPIVLNFWATWCGPCIREIPTLQDLHRSGEVTVVSISLDDEGAEKVQPFVDDKQIDYPVLLGDKKLFHELGGSAIPYTLVLDSNLKVSAAYRGLVSKRSLQQGLSDAKRSTAAAG